MFPGPIENPADRRGNGMRGYLVLAGYGPAPLPAGAIRRTSRPLRIPGGGRKEWEATVFFPLSFYKQEDLWKILPRRKDCSGSSGTSGPSVLAEKRFSGYRFFWPFTVVHKALVPPKPREVL
jgi:hypothetical protein